MPYKPRILRFDEEHADARGPVVGSLTARAESRSESTSVEDGNARTAPHDPTHDTVCGVEMDTIRDWDPDDALLADAQLQCLARQLSDDAARLATRYPAEGWAPPALESALVAGAAAGDTVGTWRLRGSRRVRLSIVSLCTTLAACAVVFFALPRVADDGPATMKANGAELEDGRDGTDALAADRSAERSAERAANSPLLAEDAAVSRVRYEDGETALWGDHPIDDSQFGPGLGVGAGAIDGLPAADRDLLRDLLPVDSHEYCDVSM